MSKTVGIGIVFVVSFGAIAALLAGCGSNSTSTAGNQAAMPTFSPGGGAYNTSQAVTIADATQGAVLYCTTDGTTPTTSSPKCAQPTTVFKTEFLQAVAVAPNQNPSAIGSAAYTIDLSAAATPTFTPAGGSYTSTQQVTIADKTTGVNIYYTTDGTTPTASSTLYTSPVSVSATETLSAVAVASGYSNSGIASATYTISQTIPSPVFSLPTGNYPAAQTVTITDTDANAAIFYTVDGSTPTSSSTPYTGAITVSQTEVVGAIAIDSGSASAVTTAAYNIGVTQTVPAPVFAPATGSTLGSGQAVTILDGDTNATIYYTTDGSTPSATSTPYPAGGVLLTTPGTVTLTAIAIDAGNSSPTATATYTVTPSAVPAPTFSPASGTTVSAGMTVTIADTDSNAVIYYTTNGSTPSASSTPYPAAGIVLSTVGPVTISAIAIDTASSTVATATYTVAPGSVPAPVFSPASGSVAQGQVILITDADPSAAIYYTTDGSTPTSASAPYTLAGVTLSTVGSASIKAIAVDTGVSSMVAVGAYTVTATSVAAPVLSPATGTTVAVGQAVTISESDAKAKIYYTLDGSTPSAASMLYASGGFSLTATGTITVQAIAIDGASSSPIAIATYSVAPASVAAPTFSPASGTTLTSGQTVTIADSDTKASIYYTVDGSMPSAASVKYTAPIALQASATVEAIAIDTGVNSTVASASYTVPVTVPAPTFSPATGTALTVGGQVTLADGDANAVIYYTEDGTPPTAASTKYTAPITVSTAGNITINAIAIDAANDSTVADATYTVAAASGTSVTGTVLSGTAGVNGAEVQLYTAGQTGYGSNGTPLGAAVSTSSTGAFTATFSSCPASPGDLVYAVATGGDAGKGANPALALMTALGACSKLSATAYTINEATTVASAYALAPFMTTAPNAGTSATNYLGLTNAFATVNNLVNVATGTALSITPAYATKTVAYLNTSTAPQARLNTLANILNPCVDSTGAGGGCSNLFSGATPTGGTAPANTLQAILNIAQHPGEAVTALFGLASSSGPFKPALATTPNDFTLAVTYTGGGLGISPTVMNGTVTYGGTSFSGVGPTQASSLAIDNQGNLWVTAGGFDYMDAVSTAPLLAEFNALGAPLTPATTVSTTNPPAVTYGGFNPEPSSSPTSLASIAIDISENNWIADNSSSGDLFEVSPAFAVSSSLLLGDEITSLAVDANSTVWAFDDSLNEIHNGKVTTLSPPSGAPYAGQLNDLTFDANGGLWGSEELSPTMSAPDLYQMNTTTGGILFDAVPAGGGSYSTTVADNAGNIYGCADAGGQTLDMFNAGALLKTYALTTGRGCGAQLVLDGQGHIFAVSNGFGFPAGMSVDEFTTAGKLISPLADGYTGTSTEEAPTINPDPNFFGNGPGGTDFAGTAAIDGSGNLWVLNPDTNGVNAPGNVLVEFVGIAAPVVTPTSVAVANGSLGLRP